MRVIVAEDDTVSRMRLGAALAHAKLDATLTADGVEAVAAFAAAGDGPILLLLDWVMPGLDGVEVCRRVRAAASAPVYIIFMTARGRQENLLEALEAGADDFVTKPFTIEALLARVRIGQRILDAARASEFLLEDALVEGLRGAGGVVVAREQGIVGRIFLTEGRIAWAFVSGEPSGIADVLGDAASLTPDEITEVIEESRVSRSHFADVLVDWGLVDVVVMRESMRNFVSARIARIAEFREARAMFLPEPRPFVGAISFRLDEVYARKAPHAPAVVGPPVGPRRSRSNTEVAAVAGAEIIEGATCVCVVGGAGPFVFTRTGEPPEENVVRALLGVHHIAGASACEELTLTLNDAFHFLQRIPGINDRYIYARVPRDTALFAMARKQVGELSLKLAPSGAA